MDVGSTVGHYKVVGKIGEGGIGVADAASTWKEERPCVIS
jgi:hypothetical protein